jgi:hypothetical protein
MLAIMEISALKTVQLSQYIYHITVKSGQRNVMKTQFIGTQCQIIFLKMNISYYGAAFMWTNIKPRTLVTCNFVNSCQTLFD